MSRSYGLSAVLLLVVLAGRSGAEIPSDVIARTKKFEGAITHMYLDSNKNVTIGVGHLVPSAAASMALKLVRKSDGMAANDMEKKNEWTTMKAQEGGHVASYYDKFAKLKLPVADIDDLLKADLTVVENQLKAKLPAYDAYPAKAKAGLIDMAFNLGVQGLFDKFPTFIQAVKDKNWTKASQECKRKPPISDERNNEIKKLFEDAAAGAH